MRTRTRRVPATTNNVTRAIINHLRSQGHYAGRINTTGIYDPVVGQFRKIADEEKGKFDIYACLAPSGRSMWIDVKSGTDRPSPEQLRFQEWIRESGGIAEFFKTYKQFTDWYKSC